MAQGGLEPPRPPVPMVRFYRGVQDLEDEAPPLTTFFGPRNMLKLIYSSFLQTVVFLDLRRDMVSMYSMNDALYRRDTYCFGLSDVCVIVVVAASFGRRRRMAVVFAVKWFISILYSSQSTETHTNILPIFERHDTNSAMNGLGLHAERERKR